MLNNRDELRFKNITIRLLTNLLSKKDPSLLSETITLYRKDIIKGSPYFVNVARYYMKIVFNIPFRKFTLVFRNKQLILFVFIGALLFLIDTATSFKAVTFPITYYNELQSDNSFSILSSSGIFLLLSNLNKKIPHWLKLFFKVTLMLLVIIRLLGFSNPIDFFSNIFYIKMWAYIASSMGILYELTSLYYLHKFYRNVDAPINKFYPHFFKDWIIEIRITSSNKDAFQDFKSASLLYIGIYLVFISTTALFK